MNPNLEMLERFKNELWKDQRRLKQVSINGIGYLEKTFLNETEAKIETHVLNELSRSLTVARVPQIKDRSPISLTMPYIKGIRLFNLFVELDALVPPNDEIGISLKNKLIAESNARQSDIQRSLLDLSGAFETRAYPAGEKIEAIVSLLSPCLDVRYSSNSLESELDRFNSRWIKFATIPFRDATPKNMVLASEELWLGNYQGEEERRQYIVASLSSKDFPTWAFAPVVDFDFSSCVELSTNEDDFVSLNYHERTWRGLPNRQKGLCWIGSENPERAAMTFLVRYYRFGGRKAAYRLLHPWGHRVRFRYDNDQFYFARLPSILDSLWPQFRSEYPLLTEITEHFGRALGGTRPNIDFFIASGLGDKRTYYVDMFVEGQVK